MGEKFLEIKDLNVTYTQNRKNVYAVNGISIRLERGKTLGLVGETGAGKTTIAKAIMRILPDVAAKITGGEIKLDEVDVLKLSEEEMMDIRGKKTAMIFQDPMTALNPLMSVGDQILEVIQLHLDCEKKEGMKRAGDMLELVGIPRERYTEYPHQFSGGMKQRVVIAMALACDPELLLADEPTTALDVTIQAQIIALMEELQEKLGMSIIIITHDLGVVADMADEIIVMYAGEIVERGTARDIFYHQQHPYTWALLQSVPRIDDEDKTILNTIEGNIPDMIYPPKGCSFCTRCPYAMKICEEEKPKVTHITDEHSVACWLMDPRADRSGVPFGRTDA